MNEWDEAFNSCSSPLEVYDINFNNEEDENSWKLYLFIYFCFLILTHCDICKKKSQQRNDMYWRNLRSTNWRVFQAPAYSKANKLTSEMLNQKGSAKWHKHKNVIFLETDGNWITNSCTKTKPRSSKAPNWTSIRSYALVRESFVMANHTPASIEAIKQEVDFFSLLVVCQILFAIIGTELHLSITYQTSQTSVYWWGFDWFLASCRLLNVIRCP